MDGKFHEVRVMRGKRTAPPSEDEADHRPVAEPAEGRAPARSLRGCEDFYPTAGGACSSTLDETLSADPIRAVSGKRNAADCEGGRGTAKTGVTGASQKPCAN